ncbi:OmpA family protein [Pararhodospirillum oryzae]|uniref:Membrane protein n=1 Tax=Pararhodospirillum oryzae TaxID=478448 RepID=A0A512H4W0_9PROT|nr:OmpA family protein [Pararhodospirillum oryzae]GEO80483.1 membrane protein [Pararhodospirillum oryzae]
MLKKVAVSIAAAGVLASCADTWDYKTVGTMTPAGSAFDAALQKEYVALAAYEESGGDWSSVAYYTAKARAATLGKTPTPTLLAERDLKTAQAAIEPARADLMRALEGDAPKANPLMAAKAQASFDCWAEEAEEDRQPERIAECKQNFEIALRALGTPPAAPADTGMPFVVHFTLGGTTLDHEAAGELDTIARAFAKAMPARVLVVGHTDTTGSADANIMLSQRRAEAVARALAIRGVPSDVMTLEAYGEERLAVPTPDNVTEVRNRRTEISFEN